MSLPLYEIVAQYRTDLAKLEELDLDEQTVADTLESLGGELEVKATNVAMFVRGLESTAAAIKDAESMMAARRKAIENRAKRVRQYLLDNMQAAGISKINHPMLALSIAKNPPSVDIFDEAQIPDAYRTDPPPPPRVPDKALIKQAISDGFDVPGARIVQGVSLRIK